MWVLFKNIEVNADKKWKLLKVIVPDLTGVAQLAGVLSHKQKGCWFDFRSGHIPRLQVRSLIGAHTGSN